jgi:hypothetical protein
MRYFKSISTRLLGLCTALALAACGGAAADEPAASAEPLSSTAKPLDSGETSPVDPPSQSADKAIDLGMQPNAKGDYRPTAALFSYSAGATNSATVNTADVYINLSAGQTISLGTCGVNGASGSGDTYLRFFNPSGGQVAYSDDACGVLSNFTYTVPATGTYLLRAGCYGSGSCSGTVAYSIGSALFSYSTSFTNSATVNTANVSFNLSAGQIITLGTCGLNGASGSGDTYLRFYDPYGNFVAYSDNGCGALSNFTYSIPFSGTYVLRAGCYANTSCSGTVAYSIQ